MAYEGPHPFPIASGGTGLTDAQPVAQIVTATKTTLSTTTSSFPIDTSIPLQSEGAEYLTVSITPKSSSNLLLISFSCSINSGTTGDPIVVLALFQDATSEALCAWIAGRSQGQDAANSASVQHSLTAGTTSSTTFKIRFGTDGSSDATLGGVKGVSPTFGGRSIALLSVTEYVQ